MSIILFLHFERDDFFVNCTYITHGGFLYFTIFVEDEDGVHHFKKDYSFLSSRYISDEREFIPKGSNLAKCFCHGHLKLQLNVHVSTDSEILKYNWKLRNQSNDINNIRFSEDLKEILFEVENKTFNVHRPILVQRWPMYSKYQKKFSNFTVNKPNGTWKIRPEELIEFVINNSCPFVKKDPETYNKILMNINDLFTATVTDHLLHYIYSGQLRRMSLTDKSKLIRLAAFMKLPYMVTKCYELPVASTMTTNYVWERYCIKWPAEDIEDWIKKEFPPITQILQPHSNDNEPFEVKCQFNKQDEILSLSVNFFDELTPDVVRCLIVDREENSQFVYAENDFVTMNKMNYSMHVVRASFHIKNTDLLRGDLFIIMNFCNTDVTMHTVSNDRSVFSVDPCNHDPFPSLKCNYDFGSLYREGTLHDMVLRCDERLFKIHKCILSARLPKLLEELCQNVQDETSVVHQVTGIKYEVLHEMLSFAYFGYVNENSLNIASWDGYSNLMNLYIAAAMYNFRDLMIQCHVSMMRNRMRLYFTDDTSMEEDIKFRLLNSGFSL
ncbi:hypothetical protein CDAR_193171 [Caerostris darwini]|uniref:BTB domain-containing protein n=1 Tax=Caerostris darwini TaxID=1538125 RepID=A0AAV4NK00_9ARAC|nr:hypothetical protein CDAR_193171 [Caerostris darwini]